MPHLVTLSGDVLTETFFGFTLLLATYFLCRAASSGRPYWYALAGLSFTYSALINPAILLFPALIGVSLFFKQRKYAVLFLLCTLIVPLAWSMRGAMLDSGRSSGERLMENVLVGTEPDFKFHDIPSSAPARARVKAGTERYRQNPLDQWHSIVTKLAEHPAYYLKWYAIQKPLRFWQWSFAYGAADIYTYPGTVSPFDTNPFYRAIASFCSSLNIWLMAAAFCIVPWIALRAARKDLKRKDIPLVLVALFFVYATVLHTALAPDPRYAAPYRPFEILLALSFVAMLHQRWRAQKADTSARQLTQA